MTSPTPLLPRHSALNTDFYQLTMAAGYFVQGLHTQRASFELYVRRLPHQRQFLVAAGLAQALEYLQNLRFEADEIDWLRQQKTFAHLPASFWHYLEALRFTGDVWALPEGTVFFPYEPLLRISAPLIEAQLVETWLLALMNYQTSVASKAARIRLVLEAQGRGHFVDFGSRRTHGPEASLLAARAAWIGGATGTSNVAAAKALNIPVVGTAAHAWTMAFASEAEAFTAYHETFPEQTTLLVDTYDTLQGVRNAIATTPQLKGIRLDSGDFLILSQQARQLLDQAGLKETRIIASGDLNEYKVEALLKAGAPIDSFGIGTELVTSIDAPSLGGVYKLVELQAHGQSRFPCKLSSGKTAYPGSKQIWRQYNGKGCLAGDLLGLQGEMHPGEALLQPVMQAGQPLQTTPDLVAIQQRTLHQLQTLPADLRSLDSGAPYAIALSPALEDLYTQVRLHYASTEEIHHV
jgi:nicotinate phosphoribosyltransferase